MAITAGAGVLMLVSLVVWSTWTDIKFFLRFESLGSNKQGYAEYRHRDSGIVFVSLPGGTFLMGSPQDEDGHEKYEGPVHEVTLSPFMIAKYGAPGKAWERGKSCRAT